MYIRLYIYTLKKICYNFYLKHIYIYIYIPIYIYISQIYTKEHNIFLQKDARQFTDFFASPEMSVRACFEG